MKKEHIVEQILRTAKANGGVALGRLRFEAETGIKFHDWFGRFWTRWSEAVREAGLEPNRMSTAYNDEILLEKLVLLARRLKRVPTDGELRLATMNDPTFPSHSVFRRLGLKPQRVSRVLAFCEGRPEYDDVGALWRELAVAEQPQDAYEGGSATPAVGYVYLFKHGSRREYKIGRTNNALRREGEIGIQLPEKLQPVHHIKTDDPAGIETYWHTRFADQRKEGEWFALTAADVRSFKRWKRIY
ncbi:MAG: GIY-YIG nuclease family protein [Isosphaeraceae bacterium]